MSQSFSYLQLFWIAIRIDGSRVCGEVLGARLRGQHCALTVNLRYPDLQRTINVRCTFDCCSISMQNFISDYLPAMIEQQMWLRQQSLLQQLPWQIWQFPHTLQVKIACLKHQVLHFGHLYFCLLWYPVFVPAMAGGSTSVGPFTVRQSVVTAPLVVSKTRLVKSSL